MPVNYKPLWHLIIEKGMKKKDIRELTGLSINTIAINSNWSARELKRQIDSSLFERLLISHGDVNKEKVMELALKGNEINELAYIIRDPYVFEFLGLPEEKPMMESGLEKALVRQIEKFLLALDIQTK